MGPGSLPIGCVHPHRLECGFTQDGLSRTFPHGRVAHKHRFVELPLILRGHSLGQTKGFGLVSQLGLLIDPKSDLSVSKVVQHTSLGLQLYSEGKFYSSHLE